MDEIQTLKNWIEECDDKKLVFFGGAGVSTESGIPDFRSQDGLYNQQYDYPPEMIISHSFFMQNPSEFYRFYFDKMVPDDSIKPNPAHLKLAELEESGKLNAVVTQNIDGLHQAAGSKNVLELHGSILRNFCMTCNKSFDIEQLKNLRDENGVPKCDKCGGTIKPDVVLYEEPLDNTIMNNAIKAIAEADLMIIAGTSLVVYPAAGLINYFQGKHIVIINKTPTSQDKQANLCISQKVGEVFSKL